MNHHLKSEELFLNRQKQDFVAAFVLRLSDSPAFQPAAFVQSEAQQVKTSHECLFLLDSLICQKHVHTPT